MNDLSGPRDGDIRRRRDSAETRRLLVEAARRRFVLRGYESTTVRAIAGDVGVNAALIKRYFGSKEGLFEAAMASSTDLLASPSGNLRDSAILAHAMAERFAANAWPETGEHPILLFLRATGDPRTDSLRRRAIETVADGVLENLGYADLDPSDPTDREVILRAQLLVALGAGVAALRAAIGVTPLAEATAEDLVGPLSDIISSLVPAHT